MADRAPGIPPHTGPMPAPVPCWYGRPGEVEAVRPAVPALNVWLAILSVNGSKMIPCYAGADTLAATAGIGRRTVWRRLLDLAAVPGLLLEIPRDWDPRSGRTRPTARWATDPLVIWRLTPLIHDELPALAEKDGAGTKWLRTAERLVKKHDRAATRLAKAMRPDLEISPSANLAQEGVGEGGVPGAVGGVEAVLNPSGDASKIGRAA
jgi:hypothetical protein